MMPVASCTPFPLSAPCDDMLTMLVCATRWLSMHLYMLAHMSMHESCLLVCRPCFNIMELLAVDLNLLKASSVAKPKTREANTSMKHEGKQA